MKDESIEIQSGGQIIQGIISNRQQFHLEVEITHPYIYWKESISIPAFSKPNPKHYLTDRGLEMAEALLLSCYLKIKELDGRWEAIVIMRNKLKLALNEVKSKCSSETVKTTEIVFDDFWKEFVFLNDDDLVLSDDQDFTLKLMIEVYNETGRQLFKKRLISSRLLW